MKKLTDEDAQRIARAAERYVKAKLALLELQMRPSVFGDQLFDASTTRDAASITLERTVLSVWGRNGVKR